MFSKPATQDLREIGYYIKYNLNNHSACQRILNDIYQKIYSLDIFPERYKVIRIRGKKFRKVLVDHYAIVYTVIKEFKLISIERVLYSARDINNIQIG